MLKNVLYGLYEYHLHLGSHRLRHVSQIFLIRSWQEDAAKTHAMGCQKFFFNPSHRQDQPAQANFSRHGGVFSNRDTQEERTEGCGHGNSGGRTVFRDGSFRHMDMHAVIFEDRRVDPQ